MVDTHEIYGPMNHSVRERHVQVCGMPRLVIIIVIIIIIIIIIYRSAGLYGMMGLRARKTVFPPRTTKSTVVYHIIAHTQTPHVRI